jgi:carboxypeptidase PM20D1
MIRKTLLAFGIAVLLLIGIVLINTFRAKPWPIHASDGVQQPLPDSAIQHMSQAIRIPTISISDSSAVDTIAFRSFNSFIERAYPLIHKHLSKTLIKDFSFVFEWKGKNTNLPPIILMSHYDVVPVEAAVIDKWSVPPFSGAITDTCIWGRGAVDDKYGVISILEGTEAMLRKGFSPQRTIYLCLGHDEEVSGRGANEIVKYLEQKNVRAEMVLDEGGQLSESRVKDVKRPIAVIGVAEKGYASFELSVEKEGGHSSMPPKETAIDILNKALYKLRKKTPPSQLTPQLKEFLQRVGPSSDNFINRMAASNLWLFRSVIKNKLATEPEGDAMMHTTIVPTILESGVKDNVIPTEAKAMINCRILTGENSQTVEEFIRNAIDDDRVKIRKVGNYNSDPSPSTSTQSPAFKRVESAIYRIIPRVLPAPYQGIGATDSRFYRRISDGVVNFFPMTDAKGYHGINERLPIRDLQRGIHFIMTIIEESDKEFK